MKRGITWIALSTAWGLFVLAGRGWAQTVNVNIHVRPFAGVPPDTITDLRSAPGPNAGQVISTWTASNVFPGSIPEAYQIRVQTFSVADVGGSTTAWWNNPTGWLEQGFYSEPSGSSATRTAGWAPADHEIALVPGTTYYFAVRSADDVGFYKDFWSEPSNISTSTAFELVTLSPAPPAGLQRTLIADGEEITISWSPVVTNEDGSPFADPPAPDEILGYNLYRSTDLWAPAVEWTKIISLSTSCTSTNTALGGFNYFYQLTAIDSNGSESEPSLKLEALSGDLLLAPDLSTDCVAACLDSHPPLLRIHSSLVPFINADTNALGQDVSISLEYHPEDVSGKVLQSVGFTPEEAQTGVPLSGFSFPEPKVEITFYYTVVGGKTVVCPQPQASLDFSPEDMGIYWNNGTRWVKLFGKVDTLEQSITAKTSMLGRYQVRELIRDAGFSFGWVSNRLITPNGDNRNDTAVFVFDPGQSSVSGKIFDLKGAFVAEMEQGPVGNSLKWDGKANGRVVPSGVYIYQIEAEGKASNGTIVVIR